MSRVNPVAYLPDDRRYLIWAANGGAPNNPDWYHNLMAHPNTRIEVGSETIDVVAEEAAGAERERRFARAAERYPQLAEVARKTSRVIPTIVTMEVGDPAPPLAVDVSRSQELCPRLTGCYWDPLVRHHTIQTEERRWLK